VVATRYILCDSAARIGVSDIMLVFLGANNGELADNIEICDNIEGKL